MVLFHRLLILEITKPRLQSMQRPSNISGTYGAFHRLVLDATGTKSLAIFLHAHKSSASNVNLGWGREISGMSTKAQ